MAPIGMNQSVAWQTDVRRGLVQYSCTSTALRYVHTEHSDDDGVAPRERSFRRDDEKLLRQHAAELNPHGGRASRRPKLLDRAGRGPSSFRSLCAAVISGPPAF